MSRSARLLLLAAGALFVLAAGALGWFVMRRAEMSKPYAQTWLGDLGLVYPPAYARFAAGRSGGRLDMLELAATFPGFEPAGDSVLPLDQADRRGRRLVFFSIGRAERKVEPADLVMTLYARFFEADVAETEEGLFKRTFQDGSPYTGEDLYFAPPEGRAFAARCARPTNPPDGLPETCLATFREGGFDVDLRFARALLPEWERLNEGARNLVASFRAR